jgi:hypothetical protein
MGGNDGGCTNGPQDRQPTGGRQTESAWDDTGGPGSRERDCDALSVPVAKSQLETTVYADEYSGQPR